jgi:hypothetical protein
VALGQIFAMQNMYLECKDCDEGRKSVKYEKENKKGNRCIRIE